MDHLGPTIPGFGQLFSLKLPAIGLPEGFPENLLELLKKLQLLIPSGILKPILSPNFGKDIFDSILSMLEKALPFLMLYKFIIPIIEIIICIIEVLCALKNPFKVKKKLKRLFRKCLPAFLNLFPILALIIMIISLLLLLLQLIKYLINQLLKLIKAILRNLKALSNAFITADAEAIDAIAKKLANLLCIFQNFFALLTIFAIVLQVIREMLTPFAPPCQDSDPEGCCDPEVCPAIVKTQYTRTTGKLQYLGQVQVDSGVVLPVPVNGSNNILVTNRVQSYQFYDVDQAIAEAFSNIYNAYDIVSTSITGVKPVFYPTDGAYSGTTPPQQAAYTLDLEFDYDPTKFGRIGQVERVKFTDCIMIQVPNSSLSNYANAITTIDKGVVRLGGGVGTKQDGTKLKGYKADGITQDTVDATLENFIFNPSKTNGKLLATDQVLIENITYKFKPNLEVLMSKDLITAGCDPDLSLDKTVINNALFGDLANKASLLSNLVYPDPAAAQVCLANSINILINNMTEEGVAEFQTTCLVCFQKLEDDTLSALKGLMDIGFDQYKSNFSITPSQQFTTKSIAVKVDLQEKGGQSIAQSLPEEISNDMLTKLKAHITFGNIDNFKYDGERYFTANITSDIPGKGVLTMDYNNVMFSILTTPDNLDEPSSVTLQSAEYEFIYAPAGVGTIPRAIGDASEGVAPRRDLGDVSGDE